jgi:signal transduction histidine kinase
VRGGNGLKNLRRRAAELHGSVEIQSSPKSGTAVTVSAPIP